MSDVVVTVPKPCWGHWLAEGGLPGHGTGDDEYGFNIGGGRPSILPGERVYVVAHGRLRGYAPLVRVESSALFFGRLGGWVLVRQGGAVALTVDAAIQGFRGWRYRWWDREDEYPFPGWKTEGAP